MLKRLAFDIDGVLTKNVYIPPEERTCQRYLDLEPNKAVFSILDQLTLKDGFEIVFITSRNCANPGKCFHSWLAEINFARYQRCGFVPRIPKEQKFKFAEGYDCAILIDDSIEAIEPCFDSTINGLLFVDEKNKRYSNKQYRAYQAMRDSILNKNGGLFYMTNDYLLYGDIKEYFKQAGIVF